MEFRVKAFFGSSLTDAGILFKILAPTLEKGLFRIPSLDFLEQKLFDEEDRVL